MRTALIIIVAALMSAACERRAGGGARIVEAAEGPWTWICAARIRGPVRLEKRAGGEGRHIQKAQARRLAIASACAEAGGGAPCSAQTAEWSVEREQCAATDRGEAKPLYTCTLQVVRAPGTQNHEGQAEAETADKACERAIREGCSSLAGGDECLAGQGHWSVTTTLARVRPTP